MTASLSTATKCQAFDRAFPKHDLEHQWGAYTVFLDLVLVSKRNLWYLLSVWKHDLFVIHPLTVKLRFI
jgi:hypothetical protein